MSATPGPTPKHQLETSGSGQTQIFECDALSADHPEIQARERARLQRLRSPDPTQKQVRTAQDGEPEQTTQLD
jgi:hypothetical protein